MSSAVGGRSKTNGCLLGSAEPGREALYSPLEAFDHARALAGDVNSRQLVLIRPDLSLLALACPDAGSMPQSLIELAESILPSSRKRNIAVVTDAGFAPAGSRAEVGSIAWTSAGKSFSFFGILTGLGCIGHSVCIFDVSADLEMACRDADILIIDGGVSELIPESSLDVARGVMRTPSIFVHDRQTFQLRPVPPPGAKLISWDALFDEARMRTRQGNRSEIVLVRADRSLLVLSCIPRQAMTKDHLTQAHRIIPERVPRNVAVIASTELAPDHSGNQVAPAVAQLRAAGRTIPFFGLVLNLASVGNPTWVFDATPDTIVPGCRNADVLFIDGALADKIPMKTLDEAAAAMRSANIAVYDRNSRKIAPVRSLSGSTEKLAFRV